MALAMSKKLCKVGRTVKCKAKTNQTYIRKLKNWTLACKGYNFILNGNLIFKMELYNNKLINYSTVINDFPLFIVVAFQLKIAFTKEYNSITPHLLHLNKINNI